MSLKAIWTACLLAFPIGLAASEDVPRACSVQELNVIRQSSAADGTFVTTGTVQHVHGGGSRSKANCTIEDNDYRTSFRLNEWLPVPSVGDRVAVTCQKFIQYDGDKWLRGIAVSVLGKGIVSPPRHLKLSALDDRQHDLFTVVTEGTVVDVLPDEIDPRFAVLLLKDGASQLPLFVSPRPENQPWLGAHIRVTAEFNRLASGCRRFSGPYLSGPADAIEILAPAEDPFAAPPINLGDYKTPQEVAAMDRRTLQGTVLATWAKRNVMLLVGDFCANVQLSRRAKLPAIGSVIKASGYPETDLYKINLVRADWKPAPGEPPPEELPQSVTLKQITHRTGKKAEIVVPYHGRLVRLVGAVSVLPTDASEEKRLLLNTDDAHFAVDFSSCPDAFADVSPGSKVEVTGRCLLEVSAWRPYDVFPQISGVTILMRTPKDLRVVEAPPWLTPLRLIYALIGMSVLLIGVFIWNRFLNRLAERRGRQLYWAEIDRVSETLRVSERTRLAVELHDSLSQNLTGVALQLKAGRLELATRALKSCREELRNCLWDLRNDAIDCDSMDDAIRQTIVPQTEDLSCIIRFNVPRKALSDNTAYAILRIIRELVTNAVRHGQATCVRIAGSLEDTKILFSVKDDGRGFDPENCPGVASGHFGLQAVRQRVATLEGTVRITSKKDRGTKVTISIPVANTAHAQEGTE